LRLNVPVNKQRAPTVTIIIADIRDGLLVGSHSVFASIEFKLIGALRGALWRSRNPMPTSSKLNISPSINESIRRGVDSTKEKIEGYVWSKIPATTLNMP
jgi:hypothetical protein